jgi:phenylalanyl-tRNA synthetase alpha chain
MENKMSSDLHTRINSLQDTALAEIAGADNLQVLEDIRVSYLGKKGKLTQELKQLGKVSAEERPKIGQVVNVVKEAINTALKEREQILSATQLAEKIASERVDVSLPGRGQQLGSLHPVHIVRDKLIKIFAQMGFLAVSGPEVEDEYHNFTALNVPDNHPARTMQDTFYLQGGNLLRTQTSPVQIRTMQEHSAPLRIVVPGKVFRCDSDMTHTPMFHQLEGLVVDTEANIAQLKSLLQIVLEQFWDEQLSLRFRPSYFPFTEPSMEVDIKVPSKNASSDWLEVLGCGMVHPNVLREVGYDPDVYQGYAFGMGLDRIAMLYFDIPDLRMLFSGDLRLLEQFSTAGVKGSVR